MSKRSCSKANIPIHRESLSCLPSPVSCLLSPVSCLLPAPPILPNLPRIHESIMQNKPNSRNDKTNATFFTAKDYENEPPRPTRKNKPNQSQFPCSQTSPLTRCLHQASLGDRQDCGRSPADSRVASSRPKALGMARTPRATCPDMPFFSRAHASLQTTR
jgi:hypothetical protein